MEPPPLDAHPPSPKQIPERSASSLRRLGEVLEAIEGPIYVLVGMSVLLVSFWSTRAGPMRFHGLGLSGLTLGVGVIFVVAGLVVISIEVRAPEGPPKVPPCDPQAHGRRVESTNPRVP